MKLIKCIFALFFALSFSAHAIVPVGHVVVQQMDANFLDASVTTINGSGGALVTVVSALNQSISQLCVSDTTGLSIGIYEGSTLRFITSPGMDRCVDVSMGSGSLVKVRAIQTGSITSGILILQFAK